MAKSIWENKLVAWLHDPAEKCFVLFHDPSGHEKGTVKSLLDKLSVELDIDTDSKELKKEIEVADYLAASADRPQWPRDENEGRYCKWSQVDFTAEPVIIHPLTGEQLKLGNLHNVDYKSVKEISKNYFDKLLKLGKDAKLKFLAMWRFAPECKEKLGQLWQLLPADTRVPDHSIWNHLDLTSAFAGARYQNKKVAVLNMAFGPVQSFIAQAKKTSDLWAGSHLLSSLVWEGMKIIADEIGPDSFLFPQIRGLAIVDAWLLEKAKEAGFESEWRKVFEECNVEWLNNKTDSNPLFSACLPNKFSAIVPADMAMALADKVKNHVRAKVKEWINTILSLDDFSQFNLADSDIIKKQLEEQLEEFPQVYMTSVDWTDNIGEESTDLLELKKTYDLFADESESFFNDSYWKTLSKDIVISGYKFWNRLSAGVVYPVVYELADKTLASAKSLRSFKQMPQNGFRCTLCGEREWLTNDKDKLLDAPGYRNTIWQKISKANSKKTEHLCAICTLKRFWPTIFVNRVRDFLDSDTVNRYVISTHTMSLIPTLRKLVYKQNTVKGNEDLINFERYCNQMTDGPLPSVVLPKKFFKECGSNQVRNLCKTIPAIVDKLRENETDDSELNKFYSQIEKITDSKHETYYALVLMDGDNMGAWLSANEKDRRIEYSKSWHPRISQKPDFIETRKGNVELDNYLNTLKTASPTRHAVISQALNNFSSKIVPDIIENKHCGKLIYSGGDDVLAMASTDEVIDIIKSLRMAYSGFGKALERGEDFEIKSDYSQKGFVMTNNKLMQVMGTKASASVGVVIVHHQTPLAYALKCLREAERNAKNAGRNAFCIRILKRAGGEISFTDNWWNEKDCPITIAENGLNDNSSIGLFEKFINLLANTEGMSRKAFYALDEWIGLLPEWDEKAIDGNWHEEDWNRSRDMASAMLKRQFKQHGVKKDQFEQLAMELVDFIWNKAKSEKNKDLKNPIKQLQDMLFCAEFFARETRSYDKGDTNE